MKKDQRYRRMIFPILSLLGLMVVYLLPRLLYNPCKNYERENAMSFSGIVTCKYIERWPKIDLDTNGKYTVHLVADPLWDSLQVGDSIIKRQGINTVVVFRHGHALTGGRPYALFRQNDRKCD
jgi:hypothetical protein